MSAVISECGKYRYRLDRVVAPLLITKPVMFIGVNPSTADADTDDQTIRKMTRFTQFWGFSSFMVGNVFAYRATDVKELAPLEPYDAVGLDNCAYLHAMMKQAALIVPCWGKEDKVPFKMHFRFAQMRAALHLIPDCPIRTLGYNTDGSPRHPLMLGYHTPLENWR